MPSPEHRRSAGPFRGREASTDSMSQVGHSFGPDGEGLSLEVRRGNLSVPWGASGAPFEGQDTVVSIAVAVPEGKQWLRVIPVSP